MSFTYEYEKMNVTADMAVVAQTGHGYQVLMVRRSNDPYKDMLCLPGGFVNVNETLLDASIRELKEETGLVVPPNKVEFVHIFDEVDRDPRGRTITALHRYHFKTRKPPEVNGADDAADAAWYNLFDLLDMNPSEFGFDHHYMLRILYNKYYCES